MGNSNSFHGRNYYKVDAKGRVPFPSQWFAPLNLRLGDSLVVARGIAPDSKFLELYSPERWEERVKLIDGSFPEGKLKSKFVRWYVSTAESIELDTQNRVRLPKHLIEFSGLNKDIVLLGCVDKIEIWSKELLEKSESLTDEDFGDIYDFLNELLRPYPCPSKLVSYQDIC